MVKWKHNFDRQCWSVLIVLKVTQQTREVEIGLVSASVSDGGSELNQHWLNAHNAGSRSFIHQENHITEGCLFIFRK